MMSSQMMHSVINPGFRCKMPLFDGTIASTGLPETRTASDFLDKQTMQRDMAYFTYNPRGNDGAQFTPPWSNLKTSLLDGRSRVSHLSGMEGENHIIQQQDRSFSKENRSHSSRQRYAPVKQDFALYTKSRGGGSPTAAASVAVRKQKNRSESSSPLHNNSVYLAIPKPVYGRHPCCDELGCTRGRYGVEHGFPPIPNSVYKHN